MLACVNRGKFVMFFLGENIFLFRGGNVCFFFGGGGGMFFFGGGGVLVLVLKIDSCGFALFCRFQNNVGDIIIFFKRGEYVAGCEPWL